MSNTTFGVELWKTENSRISSNKVSNNGVGISLLYSNNNTITGNNASNNNVGIDLESSSNNTLSSNTVCNNNDVGIDLWGSSNNKIYSNNFINNTDNAYFFTSTTIWNSPLEITYTYNGTTYESYLGNYWDDYKGTDADGDGDGIGDTHYNDESDDHPLMTPFENYILTTSAPA